MYVCMHVCMRVCVYVYTYICMDVMFATIVLMRWCLPHVVLNTSCHWRSFVDHATDTTKELSFTLAVAAMALNLPPHSLECDSREANHGCNERTIEG